MDGWVLPHRDDAWPVRVMGCMPAGVAALRGPARLSCHRWSTAARVVASVAHPRACPDMLLTASRGRTLYDCHGAATR